MENMPKPTERAPEDERVESNMPGMHVEDMNATSPDVTPIPEAPAGVSEHGVETGVNPGLEAEADKWLKSEDQTVEQSAGMPKEDISGETSVAQ